MGSSVHIYIIIYTYNDAFTSENRHFCGLLLHSKGHVECVGNFCLTSFLEDIDSKVLGACLSPTNVLVIM